MSDNDIKPVAWVERNENGHDRMWSYSLESWAHRPANPEPLYDKSAIDRLTAERDAAVADAKRLRSVIDYALAQHNYGCLPEQNHWAANAMSEIAAIDAARTQEQTNG